MLIWFVGGVRLRLNLERLESKCFNGVYKELIELIGYENTFILHNYFSGQYVTFPKRILDESYVYQKICEEYDGTNARYLSRKYDYSYSWIMKILKRNSN